MALDDLDLEFEDEDEAKKKKNEALQQDVDLEFHTQDDAPKARPQRPVAQGPAASARPANMGQVKQLDAARAQANAGAVKRPTSPGMAAPRPMGVNAAPMARSAGANALQSDVVEGHYEIEGQEILELRERARKAEFDADVKVQVAEFKTELLSELSGDMKLMEHQINQLLVRINAKHPDLKQEALMIKKILADFTSKKRK